MPAAPAAPPAPPPSAPAPQPAAPAPSAKDQQKEMAKQVLTVAAPEVGIPLQMAESLLKKPKEEKPPVVVQEKKEESKPFMKLPIVQVFLILGAGGAAYMVLSKMGVYGELSATVIFIAAFLLALTRFEAFRKLALLACKAYYLFLGGITGFVAISMISAKVPVPHLFTTLWIIFFALSIFALTKSKFWGFSIFCLQLLVFIPLIATDMNFGPPGSPIYEAIDGQKVAWSNMLGGIGKLKAETAKTLESSYLIATGQYEEGVEAKSQKPLGVFLDNVGITSRFISIEDNADMFARLRIESFKSEKPIKVEVKCYEEDFADKKDKQGTIKPRSVFNVEEFESQDLDCIIAGGSLGTGSHNIVMETTFQFQSSGFLKAYFMEQDRIRAFRRQNPDPNANPLDQFKITDKNPVGVFTGGPLKIGMGIGTQPVALVRPDATEATEGAEYGPTLGLTFDRNWIEGELASIEKLSIAVPPGLTIKDIDGRTLKSCTTLPSGEHSCTLSSEELARLFPKGKPVVTPKTVRVHTGMDNLEQSIATILSGAPMAIRSFKVDVDYTYRIKKMASVTVKAPVST